MTLITLEQLETTIEQCQASVAAAPEYGLTCGEYQVRRICRIADIGRAGGER